jgi:hypothetical protein
MVVMAGHENSGADRLGSTERIGCGMIWVNQDAMIQSGDLMDVPEKFIAKFRKYVLRSVDARSYLQEGDVSQ